MPEDDGLKLTERQLAVVRGIARGLTLDEIAKELGIAERTAKAHRDAVRHKLHIKEARRLPAALHERGFDVFPH